MSTIRKKIVKDENNHPLEVIINYQDWKEIEKRLKKQPEIRKPNWEKYIGSIRLTEDPVKYQRKIRNEWQ